jgi:hypothetical protein
MLDDFEDGELMYNNRDGYWTQWASEKGTVNRTLITFGAPQGSYAMQVTGDVKGTNWPSISVATNFKYSRGLKKHYWFKNMYERKKRFGRDCYIFHSINFNKYN